MSYQKHVDVDEPALDNYVGLSTERPGVSSPPAPTSHNRVAEEADDDPDLHLIGQVTEKRGCLFIHPGKSFSFVWGFLTVVIMMWVVLSLPFKLAFLSENVNTGDPFFAISILVDAFFCTDVVLNLYTGFYDSNDALVIDGWKIKEHYLRGWFLPDVLGALPFDYLAYAATGNYMMGLQATHLVRFGKLLQLFRLLRISNLYRFLGRYEEHIDLNTIKVVKLVFALIFWLHIDSCVYFLVARWHQLSTGEWDPESWVVMLQLQYASPTTQYFYSFWLVMSHMLSVSYGPFNPVRPEEVAMTIVSMLCGACCYASVIGTAANIIQSLDPSGTEFHRQWDELKVFMRHHNVPPALRDRLRTYFHTRWHGRKIFNENAIIKALPEPYARAMLLHECQWLLRTVPLLVSAPQGFVNSLVPLLAARTVMGGETIVEFQEPPHNWWLLSRGRAGVFLDGVRVMTLSDGAYFGDAALLWGVNSPYSVVTDTACSLYVLSRRDFEDVLGQYPDIVSSMKKEAYKQTRRMGRGIAERLRADADHASHASAFTRIHWDWATAEAELSLESSGNAKDAEEGVPVLAGRGKFTGGSAAQRSRTSGSAGGGSFYRSPGEALFGLSDEEDDVPDDVAIAWEKLRKGFDKAGGRIRAELGHVAHRMHLERVLHVGERGLSAGASAPSLPSQGDRIGHSPHADRAAFLASIRAFGGGVEHAFRDPVAAFATAREHAQRHAQRLGHGVREGVRRLAAVGRRHIHDEDNADNHEHDAQSTGRSHAEPPSSRPFDPLSSPVHSRLDLKQVGPTTSLPAPPSMSSMSRESAQSDNAQMTSHASDVESEARPDAATVSVLDGPTTFKFESATAAPLE